MLVDDMQHCAETIEVYRQRRDERVLEPLGHSDACLHRHGIVAEEVVDADTVRQMALSRVVDSVADIPLGAILWRHIVRQLCLEKVCLPSITAPLHDVFQCVLRSKAIHGHIVAIDLQSHLAWVVAMSDETIGRVVCAPQPEVVTHNVP